MNQDRYIFSKEDCQKWKATPQKNPKTNRKINPEAEFGVYQMLERQCDPKQQAKQNNKNMSEGSKSKSNSKKEASEMQQNSGVSVVVTQHVLLIRDPVEAILYKIIQCLRLNCRDHLNKHVLAFRDISIFMHNEMLQASSSTKINKIYQDSLSFAKEYNFTDLYRCVLQNCDMPLKLFFQDMADRFEEARKMFKTKLQEKQILNSTIIKSLDFLQDRLKIMLDSLESSSYKNKTSKRVIQPSEIIILPFLTAKYIVVLLRHML